MFKSSTKNNGCIGVLVYFHMNRIKLACFAIWHIHFVYKAHSITAVTFQALTLLVVVNSVTVTLGNPLTESMINRLDISPHFVS